MIMFVALDLHVNDISSSEPNLRLCNVGETSLFLNTTQSVPNDFSDNFIKKGDNMNNKKRKISHSEIMFIL